MWVQIAYFIVMVIISIATRPKDANTDPAVLEDFQIPTADEDRSIPVVFGTVTITGPNVVWHGDFRSQKDTKDHVARRMYFLGFHMVLCYGPIDTLIKIMADERDLYTNDVKNSATIKISKPDFFGGLDKGGGIDGHADIMMGEAAQVANSYLASKQSGPQPAYRGVVSVVYKGGEICANNTNVAPWSFKVKRIKRGWQDDDVWYPSKAVIGSGDMNVAHIIYECITNKAWGMGYPVESVNDAAFRIAADYYFDVQMGLSLQWVRESPIEDFMRQVIDHCFGIFGLDNDGKFVLRAADTGGGVAGAGEWEVGDEVGGGIIDIPLP